MGAQKDQGRSAGTLKDYISKGALGGAQKDDNSSSTSNRSDSSSRCSN